MSDHISFQRIKKLRGFILIIENFSGAKSLRDINLQLTLRRTHIVKLIKSLKSNNTASRANSPRKFAKDVFNPKNK